MATGQDRQDHAEGALLSPKQIDSCVTSFMHSLPPPRRWDVETSFDWASADAGKLTEGQRSAVRFVTVIEDHLPGYFALYHRYFPVDETVDRDTFLHNRELYHFTVRWAQEEDNHARALARYQVESGMADADQLRLDLAEDGQKEFTLPYEHPVQFFVYSLVQEKATQTYYQNLRQVVAEPVLADILNRLSRDEARHFAFMANVVENYLKTYGDSLVDQVRDVIANFRMPLAETINGYWRWALRIADTAGYDHTESYEHLLRLVDRAVDAKSRRMTELMRFINECRTIQG